MHEEHQYLDLIDNIILNGTTETGRNGVTKCTFGHMMRFSLEDKQIPILTTKKVAWKTCLKELLWFVSGSTDNALLKKQNVHIWDANGSREFLDKQNLSHYDEDDLGPVYGHQWRHFNASYDSCKSDYNGKGFDQLKYVIQQLKDPSTRTSRRIIMSAWNPLQIDQMALPPCHVLAQFNVTKGNQLSCALFQRSGDVGLGVPFNIASYAFLTHLLAKHCGLEPKEFVYFLGNAHIYDDHLLPLSTQTKRTPFQFPKITIKDKYENIEDYCVDDFAIAGYIHHEGVPMAMRK